MPGRVKVTNKSGEQKRSEENTEHLFSAHWLVQCRAQDTGAWSWVFYRLILTGASPSGACGHIMPPWWLLLTAGPSAQWERNRAQADIHCWSYNRHFSGGFAPSFPGWEASWHVELHVNSPIYHQERLLEPSGMPKNASGDHAVIVCLGSHCAVLSIPTGQLTRALSVVHGPSHG